ncbi:hypothetical protein ACFC4S_23830 [Priestia megaterium]|uniref:hypothetical protein n=1 Tax=Priestia megaterium TaxID=1404 RepID=UPI001DC85C2A|nr:hypothetical protein [Priestia megaterium]
MKKYIVFISSFIVLLLTFQILSGLFLTLTYAPDTSQQFSSSTVNFYDNKGFNYTILSAVVSATFSFIISKKVFVLKKS